MYNHFGAVTRRNIQQLRSVTVHDGIKPVLWCPPAASGLAEAGGIRLLALAKPVEPVRPYLATLAAARPMVQVDAVAGKSEDTGSL